MKSTCPRARVQRLSPVWWHSVLAAPPGLGSARRVGTGACCPVPRVSRTAAAARTVHLLRIPTAHTGDVRRRHHRPGAVPLVACFCSSSDWTELTHTSVSTLCLPFPHLFFSFSLFSFSLLLPSLASAAVDTLLSLLCLCSPHLLCLLFPFSVK